MPLWYCVILSLILLSSSLHGTIYVHLRVQKSGMFATMEHLSGKILTERPTTKGIRRSV